MTIKGVDSLGGIRGAGSDGGDRRVSVDDTINLARILPGSQGRLIRPEVVIDD